MSRFIHTENYNWVKNLELIKNQSRQHANNPWLEGKNMLWKKVPAEVAPKVPYAIIAVAAEGVGQLLLI